MSNSFAMPNFLRVSPSRLVSLMVAALLALATLPSGAVPVPVIASDNVELTMTLPDAAGAFSTAFDPTRPLMYVNTGQGVSIYDTTNPEIPLPAGRVELPHFENEGMTLGQREDGTTFLLIGIDLFGVNPGDGGGRWTVDGSSFYVVDVTDPAGAFVRSFTDVPTSTHTISCMNPECTVAWTSGVYDGGTMHAILMGYQGQGSLDNPVVGPELHHINGDGFGVHQWTLDDAGYVIGTGGGGTGIYDISNPLNPVPLNTTDANGALPPYNDFIQHNGDRPNGSAMTVATTPEELADQKAADYHVDNGNVLVVTEEDYDSPDCQGVAGVDAPEGGVSTWGVPYLSGTQLAADNPGLSGTAGSIEPLDTWNSELYDLGVPTPAGALCSAHYFTYHDAGFIAQGWYQQGTRILDLRDPTDIKQVGYFIAQASETWHAYWAPERDENGHVTGNDSNVLYTNDAVRGVDVLKVTLPDTAPEATIPLVAPILPHWLDFAAPVYSVPDASLGYMCRIGAPGAAVSAGLAPTPGALSTLSAPQP